MMYCIIIEAAVQYQPMRIIAAEVEYHTYYHQQ